MPVSEALETVQRYFKLWSQKDYAASRAYLADDLHFTGPFDTFEKADDLVNALSRLGPIVQEIRTRKVLLDEHSVCILYDMLTSTPIGTVPIVEIFEAVSGKITSISAFFDPRLFALLFEQQHPSRP